MIGRFGFSWSIPTSSSTPAHSSTSRRCPRGPWEKRNGLPKQTVEIDQEVLDALGRNLDMGRAIEWNAALAQEWIARQNGTDLYFYCDLT